MAKKTKKRVLPGIEIIIVLVFFLSFIMWAMAQCSAKKSSYVDETEEELTDDATTESSPVSSIISDLTQSNTSQRPTSEANQQMNGSTAGQANRSTSRPVAPPKVETVYATKLFVTIDGLKFRTGPSMDSTILFILPIDQELEFMNEVSDSTQAISLGNGVIANERWVKVRHRKGHEGWVYGAGVNYFKTAPPAPSSSTQ